MKTFESSRRVPCGTLWGPWRFLHGPRVAGPEIRARNVYVEHSFSGFQLFDGRIGSPESRSRDLWKSGIQPDLHLKILQITFIYKCFPTFCVVRGDPRVVSERMSYQVWLATPGSYQVLLATPGDPIRRSKSGNFEKPCSTLSFLDQNSGPATRGPRRGFKDPKGPRREPPEAIQKVFKNDRFCSAGMSFLSFNTL